MTLILRAFLLFNSKSGRQPTSADVTAYK